MREDRRAAWVDGQPEGLVERWRDQRRELERMLDATVSTGLSRPGALPLDISLRLLCQAMMDYLSAGHFAVYGKLLEECTRAAPRRAQTLRVLYRLLECATDHALNFNDKYDSDGVGLLEEESLPRDLSRLHRVMKLRFELEDRWVALLITPSGASGGIAPAAEKPSAARGGGATPRPRGGWPP